MEEVQTGSHHESSTESKVDQWYIREHAFSTTVVGLRGEMATKAINKLHDEDRGLMVLVEPDELDDYDEIDAEDVPDWARQEIEDQFEARAKNIDLVRQAGGSS